jgi:hypothetical protein
MNENTEREMRKDETEKEGKYKGREVREDKVRKRENWKKERE